MIDLHLTERSRRFIQNQHLCILNHAAGDFNHLLRAAAQTADHVLRLNTGAEHLQNFYRSALHFAPVDSAVFQEFIAAEQVFLHR